MPLTLTRHRVQDLLSFVDARVRRDGCDHTLRFTEQWARRERVDWHDLLDILEAAGGFCDCEVVLNLPDDQDLRVPAPEQPAAPANPWLLPPGYEAAESALFTKVIVSRRDLARTHTDADELVVPAPKGAEPRRRVRRSVGFFIGLHSGLPAEVGVVEEREPISALDFARKATVSGFEELAAFTHREAAFVLSRIAALKCGTPVASHFAERIGIASRHEELNVHRIIIRA